MNNHESTYYQNNNNHVYQDKNSVKYNAFGPFIRSLFNTVLDVKDETFINDYGGHNIPEPERKIGDITAQKLDDEYGILDLDDNYTNYFKGSSIDILDYIKYIFFAVFILYIIKKIIY